VNCVNCNGENVVTINLNLIHFCNIQTCKNWIQKWTSYVIFVKRCPNYPQNEILQIFLIKKSFLHEIQNNSLLPLYLFNHELECHEEKCTMCGMWFLTYIKNVTMTSKNYIHSCMTRRLFRGDFYKKIHFSFNECFYIYYTLDKSLTYKGTP
jgi:hypothetical protein